MTQHPIDLLPESMRAASQARAAMSRNIGMTVLAAVILFTFFTHARIMRNQAEGKLVRLRAQARHVAENERKAATLNQQLDVYGEMIARYNRVVTPIDISRILATIVARMPESTSIDQINIQAEQIKRSRQRARRLDPEQRIPRQLVAELAGFAKDDLDIAEFVSQLQRTEPFADVSLDFSRPRSVRGHMAREFRLSFTIDFDAEYKIHNLEQFQPSEVTANAE